jgi:hypothetical protein
MRHEHQTNAHEELTGKVRRIPSSSSTNNRRLPICSLRGEACKLLPGQLSHFSKAATSSLARACSFSEFVSLAASSATSRQSLLSLPPSCESTRLLRVRDEPWHTFGCMKESLENALRRFKRKVQAEDIIQGSEASLLLPETGCGAPT